MLCNVIFIFTTGQLLWDLMFSLSQQETKAAFMNLFLNAHRVAEGSSGEFVSSDDKNVKKKKVKKFEHFDASSASSSNSSLIHNFKLSSSLEFEHDRTIIISSDNTSSLDTMPSISCQNVAANVSHEEKQEDPTVKTTTEMKSITCDSTYKKEISTENPPEEETIKVSTSSGNDISVDSNEFHVDLSKYEVVEQENLQLKKKLEDLEKENSKYKEEIDFFESCKVKGRKIMEKYMKEKKVESVVRKVRKMKIHANTSNM